MIKIVSSILLLLFFLVSGLSADLVKDGQKAYNSGDKIGASKLYAKACQKGSKRGCVKLGVQYFAGDGVKQDIIKAKKLFAKACKQSHPEACFYLGTIYKRGEGGVEKNYKRARIYYGVGCRLGLPKSCQQYNLIREKRQIVGNPGRDHNFSYTYTTEIYGG